MIAQVEVAEKPILFSAPMIRAILDGSKTETRRVIKPQPIVVGALVRGPSGIDDGAPYPVGSTAWVRETFYCDHFAYPNVPENERDERDLYYAADGEDLCSQIPECECDDGTPAWKPSIFMPRWASRITLEITDVRVQRVQEISADDAIAEGIPLEKHRCDCEACAHTPTHCTATQSSLIMAYAELWDSINAKRGFGWDKNPWVWALTFKNVPK